MKATIGQITQETEEIRSFKLKPESRVKYRPGQWIYVRLTPELRHHFTLSSSPTEDYLQFTTKYRAESEFKKTLWNLKIGEIVEITGPFGSFILEEADARPRIFIAGGIGITPFRSMFKYMADKGLHLPTTLLYSVKNRGEGAFVEELTGLGAKIIETEIEGRLNEEKLKSFCPNWKESSLWLCGPPAMVEAFMDMAQKMGFAPENIKSEEFTGY